MQFNAKNSACLIREIVEKNYIIKSHAAIASPPSSDGETFFCLELEIIVHVNSLNFNFVILAVQQSSDGKKYQMSSTHEKFNWMLCCCRAEHSPEKNDKWCFVNKIMLIHKFDTPLASILTFTCFSCALIESICNAFCCLYIRLAQFDHNRW